MDQAIEDCIRLDILKELLLKHRGEVKQVILTEYNEERHAKTLLEEGRRQGREESARLLQIEREENARLLQKEQEKSAQLLQKEQEKAPSFRRNGICTSSLSASCCFRFSN